METKKIKDIFNDYKTENNIQEAKIKEINYIKKTGKLKIELISSTYIEIKDIWDFEKFLRTRFLIEDISIAIKYEENVKMKSIEEEWKNIACYMAHKYPITKPMLINSPIEVDEKKITVNMQVKGADFLVQRKLDEALSNLIYNLFETKYKVELIENISEETMHLYEEKAKRVQKLAIEKAMESVNLESLEHSNIENGEKANGVSKANSQSTSNNATTAKVQESPKVEAKEVPAKQEQVEEEKTPLIYGRSMNIKEELVKVSEITVDSGKVLLDGEIINTDSRELKSGKFLVMFDLYDGTSTITCKAFVEADKKGQVLGRIGAAKGVKVLGTAQFDPFSKEIGIMANTIIETEGRKKVVRKDLAEVKRVELHMHTQMSQMDAVTSAKDLIKRAMSWGMKSIAITDHGVVQSFPDAHKLLGPDNQEMKVIYGVEAYLVPDKAPIVTNVKKQTLDGATYCVLDLETTGVSPVNDRITEIGVMKFKDGEVIDKFACFVNPERPIPPKVVEVTNITDDMVKDAETIEIVFPKLLEFLEDSVIVAHNADFDVGFLKNNAKRLGYEFNNTYLDTLKLSRELFPDFKKHKLGIIAEKLGIEVEVAHRALDDVDTTVKVFKVMIEKMKNKGIKTLEDIDMILTNASDKDAYKKMKAYHAIILAKNYIGLRNLYKLVSLSHLHYFYKKPRILKSLYKQNCEGLILGSACEQGELYRAILEGKSDEEIENIANDYDYLEIQPLGNNEFMVREGIVQD